MTRARALFAPAPVPPGATLLPAFVAAPAVGSGTTALAARNAGRHYICGDNMLEYVEGARRRLAESYTLPMFPETIEDHKEEQCQLELLAS